MKLKGIADIWGFYIYMMSAQFLDFWTPSPLVTYRIHTTLFLSSSFWTCLSPCRHNIWKPRSLVGRDLDLTLESMHWGHDWTATVKSSTRPGASWTRWKMLTTPSLIIKPRRGAVSQLRGGRQVERVRGRERREVIELKFNRNGWSVEGMRQTGLQDPSELYLNTPIIILGLLVLWHLSKVSCWNCSETRCKTNAVLGCGR